MCSLSHQMTRYKQADFADEDTSSIGSRSIHLNEATIPSLHIRYHTSQVSVYAFYQGKPRIFRVYSLMAFWKIYAQPIRKSVGQKLDKVIASAIVFPCSMVVKDVDDWQEQADCSLPSWPHHSVCATDLRHSEIQNNSC